MCTHKNTLFYDSIFNQTETVEEPIEEEEEEEGATTEEGSEEGEDETVADDEASVEEEEEEKEEKPKTRKVEKTTWDWVQINNTKPIWLRRSLKLPFLYIR